VLFLLGLGRALWQIRRIERALPLIWVSATAIFGGVLLIDPPQSPRYVIAAPVICILVALGLEQAIGILRSAWNFTPQQANRILALLGVAVASASLYSYVWVFSPTQIYAGTRNLTRIGYLMQQLPSDRYTFFLGAPKDFIHHGTIRFLAPDAHGSDILDPLTDPAQVPAPPPGMHATYIALEPRVGELELVQAHYPGGQIQRFADPAGILDPLFAIYTAP
jgi:hypothetical protein